MLWGDLEEACKQLEQSMEVVRTMAPVTSTPQGYLTVMAAGSWIPQIMHQMCGRDAVATEMLESSEMDWERADATFLRLGAKCPIVRPASADPATTYGAFMDAGELAFATKMVYAMASGFRGLPTEEVMAAIPTVDAAILRCRNTPAPTAAMSAWITGSATLVVTAKARVDEGALSFVTTMCSSYRDSP